MGRPSRTNEQIYEELIKLATRDDKGCLVCHLAPNKKGYSPVGTGGRGGLKWRAHRFVWKMSGRSLTDDMMILHTCDNRRCIDIDHLYAGDALQNTTDMYARGRAYNGTDTFVTHAMVARMHELRKKGFTYKEVSIVLKIAERTAYCYLNGITHVR